MVKIDLKDRRILYQLDLNSRQSLTQIGKKVGLKKDIVSYRIKRMQEEGIITGFWAVIDSFKLGYSVFRFYFAFQYVTPEIKNEIIDHFVSYKNTWAVFSEKGAFDLTVILWVKDYSEFFQLWKKTLDKYGDYFAQKIFSLYIHGIAFRQSHLLIDECDSSDRTVYELFGVGKIIEIDEIDYQLLIELAINARASLIELAKKLECSSQTINNRIKNLIKIDVIKGFRVAIDISKLGLRLFAVNIFLKDHKQRENLINYIKKNPYLIYLNTAVGYAELQFEFYLENTDKLAEIMEDISSKYPGAIRSYNYVTSEKIYIKRWLPEL